MQWISRLAENLLASQEGLCSMELVSYGLLLTLQFDINEASSEWTVNVTVTSVRRRRPSVESRHVLYWPNTSKNKDVTEGTKSSSLVQHGNHQAKWIPKCITTWSSRVTQRQGSTIPYILTVTTTVMSKVAGRRGRRRKQLLDDLKETKWYLKLKEDAPDRILWRTRFGKAMDIS